MLTVASLFRLQTGLCVGVQYVHNQVLHVLQVGGQCARVRHAAQHGVQVEETRECRAVLELMTKTHATSSTK